MVHLGEAEAPVPVPVPLPESDGDASAFVLLSSDPIASFPVYALPRPPHLPLLATAALADLGTAVYFIVAAVQDPYLGVGALLLWGLVRPFVILGVVGSVRVRERSWVVLAQMIVTALVSLYHFNEIIQTRRQPPAHRGSASAPPLAARSAIYPEAHYILVSLAFSFVHYALFAIFVGIRRRHNPFVGRRVGRGASGWGEQAWSGVEESVSAGAGDRGRSISSARRSLLVGVEEGRYGSEEDDSDDGSAGTDSDGYESDEDPDAIIDIPRRGGSMRRQSRMTLRDEEASVPRRERTRSSERAVAAATPTLAMGDLRSATRFGSIKSLAGI